MRRKIPPRGRSLADAELGKDLTQDVLNVDPAGEAAQMVRGDAQFLGPKLRIEIMVNKTFQGVPD